MLDEFFRNGGYRKKPIWLLTDSYSKLDNIITKKSNVLPLGLLIDETKAVPGLPENGGEFTGGLGFLFGIFGKSKIISRIVSTLDTMMASDNFAINHNSGVVCRIPGKDVSALEFDMSDEKMELLVRNGQLEMSRFLDGSTTRYDKEFLNKLLKEKSTYKPNNKLEPRIIKE